jgi:molybdate transport system substrate-binding protein
MRGTLVDSARLCERSLRSGGLTLAALALCGADFAAGCARGADAGREPVRVAAASDLSGAFVALGRDFERETGQAVAFTFGSTGLLARQLRERAPFDLFAAAASSFVDDVVRADVCDGATRARYGRGRLALFSKRGHAPAPRTLADLLEPRFTRVAIANPEHAPYGRAAREALSRAGLWSRLEPRIVYAENVRQALQLAQTGNVEVALVALALVVADDSGAHVAIEEHLHGAIDQELVVCSAGKNAQGGRAFAAYLGSPAGRAVMRRYGFLLPGDPQVVRQ